MSLVFWQGKPLFVDGKLAMGLACCCGEDCDAVNASDCITAVFVWCGTWRIHLHERLDKTVPGLGVQDADRVWYGSGILQTNTVQVAIKSEGCNYYLTWDACTMLDDRWLGPLQDFNHVFQDAPPSACGSCTDAFTLHFEDGCT